ncbi:hypothetical protein GCM10027020_20420 [Nocardioides salsibiostraticola]
MPVEMQMWRMEDDRPRSLTSAVLPSEAALEKFLEKDPSLLGVRLLIIGRQVHTPHGKFIDLLAIDAEGTVHVLELKRDRTPRDVVAQVLDYGSWVSTLGREEILDVASNYLSEPFEAAFEKVFGDVPPDELNADLQLTIVATDLDASSERIVEYLRDFGVPINAVFFSFFDDDERQYLARSWLVSEKEPVRVSGKKAKRAPWNGVDWYVAIGGGGRSWEDAHKYGFVSAGGGPRYSGRLRTIPVGDRVNVYLPGQGYAAVGITLGVAQRFDEARVCRDDAWVPLASQELEGRYAHGQPGEMEGDDIAEWVVPVRWVAARPASEAFREPGLFANPNPVCQLRQEFTLQRLAEHFDLAGDEA